MLRSRLPAVSFLLLLAGFAPSGFAKNWYVSASSGSDSNVGTSDKPFKTIQKAVDSCADGDTILVRPGTYKETADSVGGVYNRNGVNATVRSTDGPLVTFIDGDSERRVIKGTSNSTQDEWESHCLTIDGFTLRNGHSSDQKVSGVAAVKTKNCVITGCDCTIADFVLMENCLVVGNSIRQLLSRSTAINCTFVNNTTTGTSTPLFAGTVLENCVIFDNDFGVFPIFDGSIATNSFAEVSLSGENNVILSASPFVSASDYRLHENSPCIDAGSNEFVSTDLDLRGSPRVVNGTVDAGCYEYREPMTLFVDAAAGDDANDGLAWGSAKKTIQAAVDVSALDDTILVSDGVYEPFVALNRGIEIRSVNGAVSTIIDGDGTSRCATLGSSTNDFTKTTLVGFTLRNGSASLAQGHGGGAIGGVLKGCTVRGNSCPTEHSKGGGLFGSFAQLCDISDNVCADDGGGAFECQLFDCLISGNRADNSGGTRTGGGVMTSHAVRCTIVNNRSVAGASSRPGGAGSDSSTLISCIVFGNTYTDGTPCDSWETVATYSCFGSAVSGTGNIVADPLFVDAANGDYRLRAGSPCIDKGSNTGLAWYDVDLSGMHRRLGMWADMGCFEFSTHREPATIYVNATSGDDANDGLSAETSKKTIQNAIEWSINGDTIRVADGVYKETYSQDVAIYNSRSRRIRIESENGPAHCFLDGDGLRRCAKLSGSLDARTESNVATLSGFTLTNGMNVSCGGASHGIVENCIIVGCSTKQPQSLPENVGAIVASRVANCLIVGNSTYPTEGTAHLAAGAALSTLSNCTIYGNSAGVGADAGGIAGCKAYNCIVTGNKVGGVAADVAACTLDHCCLTSLQEGEGNLVAFPKFADEAGGDFRLLLNSPCIDAGSDANAAGDSDLWGNARVQGAHVDIGAYEAGPESWLKVEGTDVVYNGGPNALTVTADFPGAEATILYGLSADGPFTAEAPSFTDAGEHPVWVVATAPGYSAVTNAATLLVRKKAIEPSMMCVVPDQVWDGTAKTPEVHIRDGWPDILGAANYDVEYVDNVDVGTAGVRVTGKNNYEGSFVYPFGIDEPDDTRFLVVDLSGGTNAAAYPVSYLGDVPAGGWTDEYKTTKLVLRKVREGSFWMGSPEDEVGRQDNEPRHRVTLSRGFYAGVFEVTQKQWELVMGTNVAKHVGADHPVEMVSYNDIRGAEAGTNFPASSAVDATSFLGLLREKTGLDGFDLPTEAQWEYVCRAGTESALNSGKELEVPSGYSANLAEVGCFDSNCNGQHYPVGYFLPNRWGLYDMHGNVWEWCLDRYSAGDGSPSVNPVGPDSGAARTIRVGSWWSVSAKCRSASRYLGGVGPTQHWETGGFRLFCTETEPVETVWHVDAERGDDENTGRSWNDALRTIQNAADRSVEGNTVLVTNGVYEPFTAKNKDIVIRSVEGAEKTIVDGGGTNRCATLGSDTNDVVKTTLVGFTLQDGSSSVAGGVQGGVLEQCIVQNCSATHDHITAGGGGARYSVLYRSVIRGNWSGDDGGGAARCVLFDCLVVGNHANNGADNHQGGSGGGVSQCTAERCTIAGNTAVYGNSSNAGGAGAEASTLESCIVYGNTYMSGAASDVSYCTATSSCFGSAESGTGNIAADPLFVDAANGDYRLKAGSPCIDAGDGSEAFIGETDLDGRPRWQGVFVDMGCFEFGTHYAAATQHVDQATGDDANDGLSWETAKKTIQSAVDWAADGDSILVKPGTYKEVAGSVGAVRNARGVNATIISTDGPESTIIDGDGKRRVVKGTASPTQDDWMNHALTLVGFTLQNGKHNGPSAASFCNLKNCILRNNTALNFGIVTIARLENCLVVGNVASNANLSAEANLMGSATLVNCTIYGNHFEVATDRPVFHKCNVVNCVVYGNTGCGSLFAPGKTADYSCFDTETAGTSNIVATAEEIFFDAANGDYRVRAEAPCVDAGDTSRAAGGTDLAGNPRVAHAAVDMGCYEYGVPATPVVEPGDGAKFAKNSQSVTLTCADPDAKIYHTVDGSGPWTNSASSVKFSIRETTTVKAIAVVRDDWASEVATATIVRVYVAQAPDGLAAAQEGAGIALSWDGVETADSYRVYRGSSPDLAAATLLGSTDGLSWNDAAVEPGKTYYYFVVSENIAGVSEAGVPALGSTLTLATAVNMPQLVFTTGDANPWVPEKTEDSADGVHRAGSASPGDDGESWLQTTVEGPGQIDFRWRASCERDDSGDRDWDHLEFLVDGVEKARLDDQTKWERESFVVEGEGTHVLRWAYVKDGTMAAGEDRGFLDCVQWIPEATKGEWEAWIDFHGIGSPRGYEALKPLPSGKGDTLWEEFVAGLNPLDALSRFLADILVPGDEPEISWHPDLGARRVYTVEGKPFLTNEVWTAPAPDSRFFRVWVALPE